MSIHMANASQELAHVEFEQCLDRQRAAYLAHAEPSHAERVADLKTLARMLKDHRERLVQAICGVRRRRSSVRTFRSRLQPSGSCG
jgi:hypothetical protein